jgi:hypothetical protein
VGARAHDHHAAVGREEVEQQRDEQEMGEVVDLERRLEPILGERGGTDELEPRVANDGVQRSLQRRREVPHRAQGRQV